MFLPSKFSVKKEDSNATNNRIFQFSNYAGFTFPANTWVCLQNVNIP